MHGQRNIKHLLLMCSHNSRKDNYREGTGA